MEDFYSCDMSMQEFEVEVVATIPQCDPKSKPFVGKRFATMDEATSFYKDYALKVGFDVRKNAGKRLRDSYTNKDSDIIASQYLVCSRQGQKFVSQSKDVIRKRCSNRCSCNAKILVRRDQLGGYVISKFDEEHNHKLIPEEHKLFMRGNRQLDIFHQSIMLDCFRAGIGPTKSHNLLCEMMGGREFVGATVVEARNFSRDMKSFVGDADAQVVLNEMSKKRDQSKSFVYEYEVDEKGRLNRLFWCDAISRNIYRRCGDVVAFDTTYSTNKYCMIFAPFTGKDNHGNPVTFAAGLISKEDAESFEWLFKKFVFCMGSAPKMIITDQDPGMKAAIEISLPNTKHRWCMWHIMTKVPNKISNELISNDDFRRELNACVWSEFIEPLEFEHKWRIMVERYGLSDNNWFEKMFEDRFFWIPAFFRDSPMSGILRTTSVSESENSAFKNYGNSRSNLVEFMIGFNNALDGQRHKSAKLDYIDETFGPTLSLNIGIERHASKIYTANVFKRIQEQMKDGICNCKLQEISQDGESVVFKILDYMGNNIVVWHSISDGNFECSCKMFHRHGYACSHLFLVFNNRGLMSIPEYFINSRWLKTSYHNSVQNTLEVEYSRSCDMDENFKIRNNLIADFFRILDKMNGDKHVLSCFSTALIEAGNTLLGDVSSSSVVGSNKVFERFFCDNIPSSIEVRPPNVVKTKGSGSRLVSKKEAAVRKSDKPPRKCANCKQMAHHDSRNCPF